VLNYQIEKKRKNSGSNSKGNKHILKEMKEKRKVRIQEKKRSLTQNFAAILFVD